MGVIILSVHIHCRRIHVQVEVLQTSEMKHEHAQDLYTL